MKKYLKDEQYYIDLYDRHTVEHCRMAEKLWTDEKKELPLLEGKKVSKEGQGLMKNMMMKYWMHFETGERYLNKDKTIRKWMDDARSKDELYESAQAPENIRCLTCRSLLKSTFKELWIELNKEDLVLFMYDCPNKCLPHRSFFSNGEECRTKPNLCPSCEVKVNCEEINTKEKLTINYSCPKCSYTKAEEIVWTQKQEEVLDENFVTDRDRFCITDEEGKKYQDDKWKLEQAGKFMEEWKIKEDALKKKLEENPDGFHLEGAGYTCAICRDNTPEGDNWYDKYGIKCLVCQKAIENKEIPAHLNYDREDWYSEYDIESSFNSKASTLRSWVKKGILKQRVISRFGQGQHAQIFLIEDNKDILPPKELVKSHMVNEIKDGKEYQTMHPWYHFGDPKKTLKGYKIMDHLRIVPPEKVKAQEEEKQRKWEEKRARREQLRSENKTARKLRKRSH